jgi:hypothetical protein
VQHHAVAQAPSGGGVARHRIGPPRAAGEDLIGGDGVADQQERTARARRFEGLRL